MNKGFYRKYGLGILLLSLGLGSGGLHAAGGQLYRYLNDKGVTVIDDRIPPEYSSKGYDVINSDGSLVRRVPRQLSEEELLLRNTDEAKARFKDEEEQRLRDWDKTLMLRYSTVDDIEAVRERAIRDIQLRISILKSNLMSIKSQIEREQQKAADIERRGSQVPAELSRNINILRLEIEDTEQSIAVRRKEISEVKASYQSDIDRFNTLLDRVQMRRYQSSQQQPNKRAGYH